MAARRKPVEIDVDPRTKGIPDEALDCREGRHMWESAHYERHAVDERGRLIALHKRRPCTRCGTVRTTIYDFPSFQRHPQRYEYSDGYLIPTDGSERLSLDAISAAQYMRQVEEGKGLT